MGQVRSVQALDGCRLEYEVEGSGYPLLMLHGFLAGRRSFSRQVVQFASRFRLIVPSARGHDGSGDVIPTNYGPGSSDVDDLCAVLDAESIDRAHVIAHSSGGATAMAFALRFAERLERLVLVEPSLLGIAPATQSEIRAIREIVTAAPAAGPMESLRASLALLGGDEWAKLDEGVRAARLQAFARVAPLVAPHWEGLLNFQITEASIRRLRPPTLLVYGSASYPFERVIANCLARMRPDLELQTIEGAAHNAHRDRADEFNTKIMAFLGVA